MLFVKLLTQIPIATNTLPNKNNPKYEPAVAPISIPPTADNDSTATP